MMNAEKHKKKEAEIAEADSSTGPLDKMISKLKRDCDKLKHLVKPNSSSDSDDISDTSDTDESDDEGDDENSDGSSSTVSSEPSVTQNFDKNEVVNKKITVKEVSQQTEDWSMETAVFLQDDVIVISDTENP